MAELFNCPTCGAPLHYDGGPDLNVTCPFCKNSVIVPEALRTASKASSAAVPSHVTRRVTQAELARQTSAGKKSSSTYLIIVAVLVVLIIMGTVLVSIVISAGGLAFMDVGVPTLTPTMTPTLTPTPGFASQIVSFGSEGTGAGSFDDLRSIAVDPDGNIYTGEWNTARIQVFDSSGKFVNLWNLPPKTTTKSLAVDRSGGLYVVSLKLDHYDGKSGKLLNSISYADEAGINYGFTDVFVAPDGTVVVGWFGETDDILFFDSGGHFLRKIKGAFSGQSGENEMDMQVAVDGLGNVYAVGFDNCAVFKFGPDGKFINRFGSRGDKPGQFNSPESIAVDSKGRVYVGDGLNVHVFDSDGRYLDTFDAGIRVVFGMVFNGQGDLLIAARDKVLKFRINDLK